MIPGIDLSGATGGPDDFGSDTFSARFGDFIVEKNAAGINWTVIVIGLAVVIGAVVISRGK